MEIPNSLLKSFPEQPRISSEEQTKRVVSGLKNIDSEVWKLRIMDATLSKKGAPLNSKDKI